MPTPSTFTFWIFIRLGLNLITTLGGRRASVSQNCGAGSAARSIKLSACARPVVFSWKEDVPNHPNPWAAQLRVYSGARNRSRCNEVSGDLKLFAVVM